MKTVLTRIMVFIVLLVLCLTACSDDVNDGISIRSDGFSKPGFAAETGDYTFVTDYDKVYKINNKTNEMIEIFSSDDDDNISNILLYSEYIFIQDDGNTVFITDYDGEILGARIDISIIFIAGGYIYYENDTEIRRVQGLSYDTELIAGKNEWGDHVAWTDYIGYYGEKIYFQLNNDLVFTLNKDGEKRYYCDGEFITLHENKLILLKEDALYSKDLITGKERRISFAPSSEHSGAYTKYIGYYADKEYYIIGGKIFADGKEITVKNGTPIESVSNAVVVNEWIYANSGVLFRYNIETQKKELISYLDGSDTVFLCNHHLYYTHVDEDEVIYGIYRIDLDDYSCKQIYDGSIFYPENPTLFD